MSRDELYTWLACGLVIVLALMVLVLLFQGYVWGA